MYVLSCPVARERSDVFQLIKVGITEINLTIGAILVKRHPRDLNHNASKIRMNEVGISQAKPN